MERQLKRTAVRINKKNGQRQLHTLCAFQRGDVITEFSASEVLTTPSYLTVQVGIDKHILLSPVDLQFCNHSCVPNVFFDTTTMQVVALREIAQDEELSFFYPSTEWTMAQPFQCYCSHPSCLGLIEGAAFIPKDILDQYRLTDFVLQQRYLQERLIA